MIPFIAAEADGLYSRVLQAALSPVTAFPPRKSSVADDSTGLPGKPFQYVSCQTSRALGPLASSRRRDFSLLKQSPSSDPQYFKINHR
jgi:hypothetical protein